MPDQLSENVVIQLSRESFDIPTLPHVATQALALAQDDESTTRQLADLICQDQALAASLLKLANSPAFAGARAIVSLQQAITMLGMQTVAELALTICVQGSLFPKKTYVEITRGLWSHALATALFAKEVARQQRRNVEAAYLCGLLHRIGMPIVLKAITEVHDRKNPEKDQDVTSILDKLHVEIGIKATNDWHLPSQVLTAIANSADYESAKENRHVAAVVHLSSKLATALIAGEGYDDISNLPVLDELSIYPNHLTDIVEHEERIEAAIA